jgi:hypothetical protein
MIALLAIGAYVVMLVFVLLGMVWVTVMWGDRS